ncbi:MAG TPA: hypothetical protein VFK44_12815 [Bacillales bacterium]|nr:hypothetical protein [Bacillales bacterium]
MQNGLFFYWTAWAAWTAVTFILPKGNLRTEWAVLIMAILIASAGTVEVAGFESRAVLFILLAYGYYKLSQFRPARMLYAIFTCHIIMLAYVGFSLYILYNPAVLWIDRNWLIAGMLFVVTQLLVKDFSQRLVTAIVGAVHGNLMYALYLKGLALSFSAGSFQFLDGIAGCLAMIVLWHSYEQATVFIQQFMKRSLSHKRHYPR